MSKTPLMDRIQAQVEAQKQPKKPLWVQRNEEQVQRHGRVAVADKTAY